MDGQVRDEQIDDSRAFVADGTYGRDLTEDIMITSRELNETVRGLGNQRHSAVKVCTRTPFQTFRADPAQFAPSCAGRFASEKKNLLSLLQIKFLNLPFSGRGGYSVIEFMRCFICHCDKK